MKSIILTVLVVFMVISNLIFADLNPCLYLYHDPADQYVYNPDSVMIDTCWQSPTAYQWYAKKTYILPMSIYVWGEEVLKWDSVYTWRDMDSTFKATVEGFKNIEQIYGIYSIKRSDEAPGDSLWFQYPTIELLYNNYFLVESILSALDSIVGVDQPRLKYPPGINYVVEQSNIVNNDIIKISRQSEQFISININTNYLNLLSKFQNTNIYDLYGRLIQSIPYNNNEILFDISNLTHGVYIVSFSHNYKLFII